MKKEESLYYFSLSKEDTVMLHKGPWREIHIGNSTAWNYEFLALCYRYLYYLASLRWHECNASLHHPKMLPKSSPRAPKSLPRAPKELPRSSTELPRTSKERPRSPQISQQSPSSSQGLSKVRPKGLRGTLWEAFWNDLDLKIEASEPILTHFLSWALQLASLNVTFDLLFAFSPSSSYLRTSHIASILFIVLPSTLKYQVVPRVASKGASEGER